MFGRRVKPSLIDNYINVYKIGTVTGGSPMERWRNFLIQITGKTGSLTYLENTYMNMLGYTGSLSDMIKSHFGTEDQIRTVMNSTKPNLITNPNFEVDTAGWFGFQSTIARNTAIKQFGAASLEVTVTATSPGIPTGSATLSGMTIGKNYQAVAYVQPTTLRYMFFNSNQLSNSYSDTAALPSGVAPTGKWTRIVSGVCTATATTGSLDIGLSDSAVSEKFYIDTVELREI